jgi:RNA processing factor Prp31
MSSDIYVEKKNTTILQTNQTLMKININIHRLSSDMKEIYVVSAPLTHKIHPHIVLITEWKGTEMEGTSI